MALTGCDEQSAGGAPSHGPAGGKADDADGPSEVVPKAVTASSIEALEEDLSSVRPEVVTFGDGLPPEVYLRPMSALGPYGPVGPYGPLGVLGPVGDGVWNPSTFIELAGPWSDFADRLGDNDGPLSSKGPLGADGPLNRDHWNDADATLSRAFFEQLGPGGVLSVLGPIGPLGALGPLGPLGPVGAHGYVANDAGEWTPGEDGSCVHSDDDGEVCRTAVVAWDESESRRYELFEDYDGAFAREMDDNDTSFMVGDELSVGDEHSYPFSSHDTQVVTVVAFGQWTQYDPTTAMGLLVSAALDGYRPPSFVPGFVFPFNFYDHETSFDDFDLTLTIADGETVREVHSNSASLVDWISVVVPAGAELTATVSLDSKWSAPWRVFGPEYRLFVVGSTENLVRVDVAGDHFAEVPVAN